MIQREPAVPRLWHCARLLCDHFEVEPVGKAKQRIMRAIAGVLPARLHRDAQAFFNPCRAFGKVSAGYG